jgi:hypothetical protein
MQLQAFLTPVLDDGGQPASRYSSFTLRERASDTQWTAYKII